MIICSALYYPGSLAHGDLIVRDNRFYPAKYADTLPVWLQYVRRHYPDTHLVLFADEASPVPIRPLLAQHLRESWRDDTEQVTYHPTCTAQVPLITVKWTDQFAGQYFRPMQRNLVEAIILAYRANEDLFWLDADAFLNTDVRPLLSGAEVASSGIQHHQQTMGSVCFYLSKERLHALDPLGIDLPAYLTNMLNTGPENARMHALQEGGLYKLFCYGRAKELSHINMSHLSCYPRFLSFLRANPLDTVEYRSLVAALEGFDFGRIPGVQIEFADMLHSEAEGAL
jgi:hypothetical protein